MALIRQCILSQSAGDVFSSNDYYRGVIESMKRAFTCHGILPKGQVSIGLHTPSLTSGLVGRAAFGPAYQAAGQGTGSPAILVGDFTVDYSGAVAVGQLVESLASSW